MTQADRRYRGARPGADPRRAPGPWAGRRGVRLRGAGVVRALVRRSRSTARTTTCAGVPLFATLLGRRARRRDAGRVSSPRPALAERWFAWRGGGAWGSSARWRRSAPRRCAVSAFATTGEAQILYSSPVDVDAIGLGAGFAGAHRTELAGPRLRRLLGLHARLAEGAAEAMIEVGIQPWDLAAPMVLVEEAGGRITDSRRRAGRSTAPAWSPPTEGCTVSCSRRSPDPGRGVAASRLTPPDGWGTRSWDAPPAAETARRRSGRPGPCATLMAAWLCSPCPRAESPAPLRPRSLDMTSSLAPPRGAVRRHGGCPPPTGRSGARRMRHSRTSPRRGASRSRSRTSARCTPTAAAPSPTWT